MGFKILLWLKASLQKKKRKEKRKTKHNFEEAPYECDKGILSSFLSQVLPVSFFSFIITAPAPINKSL